MMALAVMTAPQLQMRKSQLINQDILTKKESNYNAHYMRIIHMIENNYLKNEEIKKRLTEQMLQHRETLGLRQGKVAELLDKSEKTYQRWESTGDGLSDFFDIQNIFRVLQFSTTEIINLLELPTLTPNEIKELYQDEETLKSIQEDVIRQKCGKMQSITIEKLLCILLKEYLKRKGHIL